MSRFFYSKLAVSNIKKNGKTYLPYILTCVGMVAMFYMICSLAQNDEIYKIGGGGGSVTQILGLGCAVTGFFALIFLFYTNGFLMKRRKKEFGLYNILGMEKIHISKVVLCETSFIAVFSIIVGLLIGILLDKVLFLALMSMFDYEIAFGFQISLDSILMTVVLFCVIFLLIFLRSFGQIHLSKPIELLKGGQVGEREPKMKLLLAVLGTLCLSAGYYIALTTKNPLEAIPMFFVAVILVIVGTYLLFTTGSIAFLKLLRKNKSYYYNPKHFTSLSGMMYRMKQNAVGLANICILSTAVLVMVSSTLSLFVGMEDILTQRYPKNIIIQTRDTSKEAMQNTDDLVGVTSEELGLSPVNELRYNYLAVSGIANGNSFDTSKNGADFYTTSNICTLIFIPLEDYNHSMGTSQTLSEDEVLIYSTREEFSYPSLKLFDSEFTVKEKLTAFAGGKMFTEMMVNSHFIITNDLSMIAKKQEEVFGDREVNISNYYGFDLDAEDAKESFLSLYGGLFFIGIFLGILFIMATILIIYYKQISEGYDDKERFEIMQKVGMSKSEIRKSIRSQVLTIFFLPLIMAGVHIAFAFPMITRLLDLFQFNNVTMFALCTLSCFGVFAVLYGIVYSMTAKIYYKIVS